MPKDRRVRSLSFDRSRVSPYPCNSKSAEQYKSKIPLGSDEDVREWEEARCPICMEHPHNAVLLQCSSREKGCRPYMCNTSHRHSNCLDQFRKSMAATPSTFPTEEVSLSGTSYHRRIEEWSLPREARHCEKQLQPELVCPLCRGQISGWDVIEPARRYMNSKPRSCSCETCDFSGTYSELRKHARLKHPSVRPSDVDPTRQRDWIRLERERNYQDALSMAESGFGDERNIDSLFSLDFEIWLALTAFFETLFGHSQLGSSSRVSQLGSSSRVSRQLHNRRSARTWRSYDMVDPAARRHNNGSSERMPSSHQQRWRQNQRWSRRS